MQWSSSAPMQWCLVRRTRWRSSHVSARSLVGGEQAGCSVRRRWVGAALQRRKMHGPVVVADDENNDRDPCSRAQSACTTTTTTICRLWTTAQNILGRPSTSDTHVGAGTVMSQTPTYSEAVDLAHGVEAEQESHFARCLSFFLFLDKTKGLFVFVLR